MQLFMDTLFSDNKSGHKTEPDDGQNKDVNETLHDETETFKKQVSRRPRPRRSHRETETFNLIVYICNSGILLGMFKNIKRNCLWAYRLT